MANFMTGPVMNEIEYLKSSESVRLFLEEPSCDLIWSTGDPISSESNML